MISLTSDNGVTKRIINKGKGHTHPTLGQKVEILYESRISNGFLFDYVLLREDPFSFFLGDGGRRVVKGWDIGIATMLKGEKSEIICCPDYAYGQIGMEPKVPPNCQVSYIIELIDFYDCQRKNYETPIQQRFLLAKQLKDSGNQQYAAENYIMAKESYYKAKESLLIQDVQQGEGKMLYLSILLNIAQVLLKLKRYQESMRISQDVLEIDAKCAKALYKLGLAYFNLQDYQEALTYYKKAQDLETKNVEISAQISKVKQLIQQQLKEEKKMCVQMIQNSESIAFEDAQNCDYHDKNNKILSVWLQNAQTKEVNILSFELFDNILPESTQILKSLVAFEAGKQRLCQFKLESIIKNFAVTIAMPNEKPIKVEQTVNSNIFGRYYNAGVLKEEQRRTKHNYKGILSISAEVLENSDDFDFKYYDFGNWNILLNSFEWLNEQSLAIGILLQGNGQSLDFLSQIELEEGQTRTKNEYNIIQFKIQ